ncbi:MAG: Gldg family protein, partial [Proteobacteria bacterium]|nr:Gldg family protein [Pseudomonadota bacterium]
MDRRIFSGAGLLLLAVAFLVFALFNNAVFRSLNLDLTEHKLYTLSDGSKEIIASVDEPINLYFFFSDKASSDLTALRSYATRVRELLEQYERLSNGKIKLSIIDPEPFSEQEDQAAEFGLQAVPVSNTNELYFGLAGTNAIDGQEVIRFFQPDKEEFLEYEISRIVQALASPEKPVMGLMSSLKMQGDINMQTFQPTPAWVVIDQLGALFDIKSIDLKATEIPADVKVLMIVHPKSLSDETLFAIDQFALAGGRVLAFVDPLAEMDQPDQANPMMPSVGGQASDMGKLFSAWGITLRSGKVLGDAQIALEVGGGANGQPVRHLAILGLMPENLSRQDVVTAPLESINVATAGILDVRDDATTAIVPLIQSSEYAMPIDASAIMMMSNPQELQQGFKPTGERMMVAARISGHAMSAFPEGLGDAETITDTNDLNVIVVADTDLLSDRLWVQVQNFFGQRIASPWANNGDFVVNSVDNLAGSSALISVRSRGRFTRPFNVVQDLRREAESRYLDSANDLQAQLSETELKLTQLQSERKENSLLSLSPEQ